jgi:biopolymer transport protein ExbD
VLKRPSSRRRSQPAEVSINLVPMLDALVTMIAFLMYTMAFLQFTMLESPLPIVNTEENLSLLKEKPLQLTLTMYPDHALLWSPFDLIQSIKIQNLKEGNQVDTIHLHEALLGIKQKHPNEEKLVLIPEAQTSYDTIVALLDSARVLEKTDPVIVVKNPATGIEEPIKTLFPEIVFGNLLGDEK